MDHICSPKNDSRRSWVMAAGSRLLNTTELSEAAANLEAVTGITAGMLEALHRQELEAWHQDIDTSSNKHAAWYQRWKGEELERHQAAQRQAVLDWAHVRRGSDLFVRGLGRFNIDATVSKSLADVFCHAQNKAYRYWPSGSFYSIYLLAESTLVRKQEAERSLKYDNTWVLRPRDLQARGHFPELAAEKTRAQRSRHLQRVGWLLALPDDHPIRCHLIRFHSYWTRPDNANTLHELVEAAESLLVANVEQVGPRRSALLSEAGVKSMIDLAHLDDDQQAHIANCTKSLPTGVLQILVQNAAAELPRRWSAELTAGTKPITLLRRVRELQTARLSGPDVHFTHLDSLADGPINACGEQLQVLRSKYAIIETAKRLRNCAASFATRVKDKRYVLVSLVDTKTGAPKALGGANVSHIGNDNQRVVSDFWDQVVEHSNKTPSPATQAAFDAYLPSICSNVIK